MKGTTHLATGLLLAAITQEDPSLATSAGFVLGSLVPDIDKSGSLLGKYIPVLPKFLKHRTVTHTLWVPIILWALSPAMAIGCILHLILDACNPEGIPLIWPFMTKRQHMPIICVRSGGFFDRAFGALLWILALYMLFHIAIGDQAFHISLF